MMQTPQDERQLKTMLAEAMQQDIEDESEDCGSIVLEQIDLEGQLVNTPQIVENCDLEKQFEMHMKKSGLKLAHI